MPSTFVWFVNSETAVNMDKALGFRLKEGEDGPELHFWLAEPTEGSIGYIISDAEDIRGFLKNFIELDELPSSLIVTQVVDTVEAGASMIGAKIDTIG
jgi:hypothetical protein